MGQRQAAPAAAERGAAPQARAGEPRASQGDRGRTGRRTLEREYADADALVQAAPETEARISDKQSQLEQMQGEHATARAKAAEAGKARKAALRFLLSRARSQSGRVRRRGAIPAAACRGFAEADGSSAGRDRGRSRLARRGAADRGDRRRRPSRRETTCTRARRPRGARGSSTPRRRCRPGSATTPGRRGSRATDGGSTKRSTPAANRRRGGRSIENWRCARGRAWRPGRSRRAARAR